LALISRILHTLRRDRLGAFVRIFIGIL